MRRLVDLKLEHSKQRMPGYYKEDPVELFRRNVWINPFWEDRIPDVVEHMGADRGIYGSDWPHMEGLERPRDILDEAELDDISLDDPVKILYRNTAELRSLPDDAEALGRGPRARPRVVPF